MKHTRLWILSSIIAGALLISFALSVPHTTQDVVTPAETLSEKTIASTVALRDSYSKGVHTISGSLDAPNPCTSLSVTATLEGTASSTTGILIDIAMPTDTGVCLDRVTTLSFTTKVTAPAAIPIRVKVNGEVTTTTTP